MSDTPSFENATILVVEDARIMRHLMGRYLRQSGFSNVLEATNGVEALEVLRARPVDLVILDIIMPEMDGYETLAAIRADEGLRRLPVIMITSVDDIESVARCIEMGAEDYMPKMFNPILLKCRINACLERRYWKEKALSAGA